MDLKVDRVLPVLQEMLVHMVKMAKKVESEILDTKGYQFKAEKDQEVHQDWMVYREFLSTAKTEKKVHLVISVLWDWWVLKEKSAILVFAIQLIVIFHQKWIRLKGTEKESQMVLI